MSHLFHLDLIMVTSMIIFSNQIIPVQSCCCELFNKANTLFQQRLCFCNFFGCDCDKKDERFSCYYGFIFDLLTNADDGNCSPGDNAACPRFVMSRCKHLKLNRKNKTTSFYNTFFFSNLHIYCNF